MQFEFFSQMATTIQKYYRGFYDRKYKHDFYARKQYLLNVVKKNEEVMQELNQNQLRAEMEESKRKEDVARLEMSKVAANVHHLVSTRAIPGIYNSPFVRDGMRP